MQASLFTTENIHITGECSGSQKKASNLADCLRLIHEGTHQ